MIFTMEEIDDDIVYMLEIEGFSGDPDAEPKQGTYQRVIMSAESVRRLKKLQGSAELDEVVSVKLRFVNIRPDVLHSPIELAAVQLDNLISAINLVTSGFMPKQFKGMAFSADGMQSNMVLR